MDSIEEKRSSSVGLPFPKGYTPYIGNWRNIRPETYKHFDAFLHHETHDLSIFAICYLSISDLNR